MINFTSQLEPVYQTVTTSTNVYELYETYETGTITNIYDRAQIIAEYEGLGRSVEQMVFIQEDQSEIGIDRIAFRLFVRVAEGAYSVFFNDSAVEVVEKLI
jgi:hypothetical protein